jgi:carboxymethylenebutenolidase
MDKDKTVPTHNLVAVWEKHLRSKFVARDADAAMDTMVPDAYVNHVPTMTGGVVRDEVKRFYKYHLVDACPWRIPDYAATGV